MAFMAAKNLAISFSRLSNVRFPFSARKLTECAEMNQDGQMHGDGGITAFGTQ